MDRRTRTRVEQFVSQNIDSFHRQRLDRLAKLKLNTVVLKKNPYLFRAKNVNRAPELVNAILEAYLSSSEEGAFGGFLERLAIYVAEITGGGQKSAAEGIDIELVRENVRYLIAVKSGKNWGNSDQHKTLKSNFKRAVKLIRQADKETRLQPTLGICYGKFKTKDTGEYLHIGGQSFWHLISGDARLYIDIIEPLGYKAEEHDIAFREQKDRVFNRMVREFTLQYCDTSGAIDWERLVRAVSTNMDQPS